MAQRQNKTSLLPPEMLRASGALLAAQTALARLIDTEAVAPTGHDPTIVDLLTRLDQAQEHRMRAVELSRQLLISPSHVSRMLDRAEALGLVARSPDPDDRRASQVAMTDGGRSVVETFAPYLRTIVDRVIHENLTVEEVDTLVELLGRIRDAALAPPSEDEMA